MRAGKVGGDGKRAQETAGAQKEVPRVSLRQSESWHRPGRLQLDDGQPGGGDGNLYKEGWPGKSLDSPSQATAEHQLVMTSDKTQ